jgi:hypothetical protein
MTTLIEQPEILLTLEQGVKKAIKDFAKTAGTKDLRDECDADQEFGPMVLDFQLEVDSVQITHDTDKAPTVSIPWLAAMALLIKRMGITRDSAIEKLTEAMRDSLTLGKSAKKELFGETGVEDAQKMLKEEVIAKLPRTPVRKSVKVKGATLHVKSVGVE